MAGSFPERIALDTHTHLVPVHEGGLTNFEGVAWLAPDKKLSVDGHVVGMAPLFQPDRLSAWLETQNVEQAWVSVPPPLYRPHLAESDAADWAAALNRGLRALCGRHGARLRPLAHLPVEHPSLAARMAQEALATGAFAGCAMSTGGGGIMLSDASYDPLWDLLDRHAAFVLIHPGDSPDPRLAPYYLGNLLGNPFETALAAAHLVFAGVPARFAAMRLCLAHGGGAAAQLAGRWNRGFETARPGIDIQVEAPPVSLRRMFADCVVHDAATLDLVGTVFGADHVVFGSDWPFPMGLAEPHRQLEDVASPVRERLFARGAP